MRKYTVDIVQITEYIYIYMYMYLNRTLIIYFALIYDTITLFYIISLRKKILIHFLYIYQ